MLSRFKRVGNFDKSPYSSFKNTIFKPNSVVWGTVLSFWYLQHWEIVENFSQLAFSEPGNY